MRIVGVLAVGAALTVTMASATKAQDATDWGGFYASVFAGYALDREGASSSSATIAPTAIGGGLVLSGTEASGTTRIDGIFGGFGAGYNYQINQFVIGVDGAMHIGGLSKTDNSSLDYAITDGVDNASILVANGLKVDVDWYSTFAGTFGVAFDQGWLVTLKGGVAVANVSSNSTSEFTFATTDPNFPPVAIAPGSSTGAATSTQLVMGPTLGLGIAKKLTQNVSLGAEYAFVSLPTTTVPTAGLALPGIGVGAGVPADVNLGFHTLKATLKYHF